MEERLKKNLDKIEVKKELGIDQPSFIKSTSTQHKIPTLKIQTKPIETPAGQSVEPYTMTYEESTHSKGDTPPGKVIRYEKKRDKSHPSNGKDGKGKRSELCLKVANVAAYPSCRVIVKSLFFFFLF